MLIYPLLDREEALRVTKTRDISEAVKVLIDADGTQPVRRVGPENNPKREMLWTPPYKDSAGKGMMVTLLAPIYLGDEYVGAMGTDMTLKALTTTLGEHAPVFGRALVVDGASNVLADTGAALAGAGERVQLGQLFPELPSGIDSINPADSHWLRYPLKGTPWFLIVKVPQGELRARALADMAPYLVFALAMVMALLAAAGLTYRRYSRPALRLAEYVAECNGGRIPAVPAAPDAWMPLFEQVAATNRERIDLLDQTLRQSEELERKVAERTGELQAANTTLQDTVASLQQTRRDLVRADRMGALGGLIAGVANEFAGPLDEAARAAQRFHAGIETFKANQTRGLRKAELDAFVAEADAAGRQAAVAVSTAVELLGRFKQLALDQASDQARRFALRDVVDNVLAALRPALAVHDTAVENRIEGKLMLEADAGKLGQIVHHLLTDAIARVAATGSRGRIELQAGLNATPHGQRIVLTLRDSGRMAAAPQAGQSIAAAIVEAISGSTLESLAANEGSCIVLTLPTGGE